MTPHDSHDTVAHKRRRRAPRAGVWAGVLGLALAAWVPAAAGDLELHSSSFDDGGAIPARHTCEGTDVSPALAWSGVPAGTKSLVLIVDDPDAPDPRAPTVVWVHWVVFDIPPSATALPAAVTPAALPAGARQGLNDWKRPGYGGPCPPIGRHRYFHRLYALDTTLGALAAPTRAAVESAMAGHVIGRAELVGTYRKSAAAQ